MNYKEIYFKLNELAIINEWSSVLDGNMPFLFNTNDTYTTYTCDLKNFTLFQELVEGVEYTPKVYDVMEKLAILILNELPEISQQSHAIELVIITKYRPISIEFSNTFSGGYFIQ